MLEKEEQLLKYVGDCIRMYRKKRGMTVADLANRIHKSKATVSKYELGQIAVDVVTLHAIAEVLEVPIRELTDFIPSELEKHGEPCFEQFFYMYSFSTSASQIVTSVIRAGLPCKIKEGSYEATLYYDVPAPDSWKDCSYIYRGTVEFSEFVTTFNLRNRVWSREHLHIILSTPLKADKTYQGILLGLSSTTLLPISFKVAVMTKPLASAEVVREILEFSKLDLQKIKKEHALSWKRNI